MNKKMLTLIQDHTAELAVTPSALRNQGSRNVLPAARRFLKKLRLNRFSVNSRRKFREVLDSHTVALQKSLPTGARHWGSARKALNLFLRDALYNRYLSRHYGLNRVERWLEVPLDSFVATGIRKALPLDALPRWKGVKTLKPNLSDRYQAAARRVARAEGTPPVHLDLKWWRRKV